MAEALAPIVPLPHTSQGNYDALDSKGLMFGQVAPAPFIDRYQQLFGSGGLTPQQVSSVLNFANIGYLWQLADLLDEIREMDAHLSAVVAKREQQVAGAEWDVLPRNERDQTETIIARWVKEELQSVRGMQHAFSHLAGGIYYGHAVCENIWLTVNGKPRLVEIIPLHARRFAYAALTDWRLYLWDQVGNDRQPRAGMFPGVPLDAFPAGKFVWHNPRVRGGYPQREGLGRVLLWYACMKRWAFRDWMALAEWAGRGLRIGKFFTGLVDGENKNKRATPEHQAILRQTLNTFSSSSPALIADTTALEVLQLTHENKIHETLIAECDAQMSKGALGVTLTTDVGETGGNRALGETQRDEQLMLAISDEKQLSESITYGIIAPMVRYQFGWGAPVPKFKFAVAPGESMLELAKLLETLVRAGMEIPQQYGYEKFRIRAPRPGERVMVPTRVTVKDTTEADDKFGDITGPGGEGSGAPVDAPKKQPLPRSGESIETA